MPSNEFVDAAGYPDGEGTLDEGIDEPLSDVDFLLVESPEENLITAIVGDEELARVIAKLDGDRLVVRSTFVWPDYRSQGIASEVARRVWIRFENAGRPRRSFARCSRDSSNGIPDTSMLSTAMRRGWSSSRAKYPLWCRHPWGKLRRPPWLLPRRCSLE